MPLDITEYAELATTRSGHHVPSGQEPSYTNQQLAIGVSSVQSAAFGDSTRFIRLHADASCRIELGSNPTASAASMRLVAGGTEYLGVIPGLKIAVIETT
jgi:hypothetical protein